MNPDLQAALLLLLVGMTVVFAVLALLVASGHLLIRWTNRWGSQAQPGRSGGVRPATPPRRPEPVMVAILAAVDALTDGRGRVERIEKLP